MYCVSGNKTILHTYGTSMVSTTMFVVTVRNILGVKSEPYVLDICFHSVNLCLLYAKNEVIKVMLRWETRCLLVMFDTCIFRYEWLGKYISYIDNLSILVTS